MTQHIKREIEQVAKSIVQENTNISYEQLDMIETESTLFYQATSSLREQSLTNFLNSLTERERTVLIGRYNLDGKGVKTLEELAKQFNVTNQRIRQIEAKLLWGLYHKVKKDNLHWVLEVIDEYNNDNLEMQSKYVKK